MRKNSTGVETSIRSPRTVCGAPGKGWSVHEGRLTAQLAASSESAERKEDQRVRQMRQAHVRFGVLDSDKDGKMTPAEFEASGLRAFAEQDGEGVVTAAEKK